MRLLIAARHVPNGPRPVGGVQTWCATIADEFERRGSEVVLWQPGMRLEGTFDAGIFSNIADTRSAMVFCRRTLAVCHGIIGAERPPARDVVFTSEEVRDHWKVDGPIIRQPIDLGFWAPAPVRRHLVVRFSYRLGLDFIEDLAESLGAGYVHLSNEKHSKVREILLQAKCVIATGRAAAETMACGIPVVICDDRTYMGPLLDNDTLGSMTRNYSGRGGIPPTADNVRFAIHTAIERGGLRSHAMQHHDVHTIADQLLCYLS